MAIDRVEKTLVVFEDKEVRELFELLLRNDDREISEFILKSFIKKVEAILRRRCG